MICTKYSPTEFLYHCINHCINHCTAGSDVLRGIYFKNAKQDLREGVYIGLARYSFLKIESCIPYRLPVWPSFSYQNRKAVCMLIFYSLYLGRSESVPKYLFRLYISCLLYTSPSPRDRQKSRMPSSA